MTKSPNSFCLHGDLATVPEMHLGYSCRLFLKRVYPTATVQEHITITKLSVEGLFCYNTTTSRVQQRSLDLATSIDLLNLLSGRRPDVICIIIVATLAIKGEYPRSTFCSTDAIQK